MHSILPIMVFRKIAAARPDQPDVHSDHDRAQDSKSASKPQRVAGLDECGREPRESGCHGFFLLIGHSRPMSKAETAALASMRKSAMQNAVRSGSLILPPVRDGGRRMREQQHSEV